MNDYSTYSDEQLLTLLKGSDEAAFEQLYLRYWEKLLAIGFVHSNRKEIAEEIVHDVFMSLWNRRTSVEIRNLEAYFATSVKFEVFSYLRKEMRREILIEGFRNEELADDQLKIEGKFFKELIEKKLAALPAKCRIVFQYSREYEMSNAQIANQLNLSQKSVEAHITRALKYLRASVLNFFFVLALVTT